MIQLARPLPAILLSAILLSATLLYAAPVDIDADKISRTADGKVIAEGHVIIKREFDTLTADRVTYMSNEHLLEAKGHVTIHSKQADISATEALMHSGSKTGTMKQAVITLPGGERINAARVKRLDDQTFEAEEITFSSCPIDQESWRIAASHAVLDNQDGTLTTTDGSFQMWGVPILYTPWWQQPLKRKSGLLMPDFGSGKRRGTEIALPLYLAPSPDWDTTITPRWMSARGVMGQGELRHAWSAGRERIDIAAINDTVTGTNRSRLKGDLHWQLPANMRLDAEADHVSDHDYLADYATGNDISSIYLQSHATLSQTISTDTLEANWMVQTVHLQNMLRADNATTLQIHPRFQSGLQWAPTAHSILHFDQQTTRFNRRSGIDGWRLDLHPYIEMPWQLAGGGISATITGGSHHTRYWLHPRPWNPRRAKPETRFRRTTAEASAEIRSDFERIADDRNWRHAISPILRYDFINARDQSALPLFDSAFGRLTMSNLLSGNRFSGYDRIENSSRFSMLIENRLQQKSAPDVAAVNILTLRFGAAYDLIRRSVDARRQADAPRPFSNLLGELIINPFSGASLSFSGQYNSSLNYWATLNSAVNWRDSDSNNRFHAGYHFTDSRYSLAVNLIDVSAAVEVASRWLFTGRWQYDMGLKLTQQSAFGLQYRHPCWTIGVEGYRINRRSGTSTAANSGARLLLEFKGLGSVGSNS